LNLEKNIISFVFDDAINWQWAFDINLYWFCDLAYYWLLWTTKSQQELNIAQWEVWKSLPTVWTSWATKMFWFIELLI